MDADQVFAGLVGALSGRKGVSVGTGRGFGSGALKADGRSFGMVSRGHVVLKLPATRVSELIEGGEGESFDAGKGRPMREWVMLAERPQPVLLALAEEALAFARH